MKPEFLRINWIGIQEGGKSGMKILELGKHPPSSIKTFLRQLREGLKHKKGGGIRKKIRTLTNFIK